MPLESLRPEADCLRPFLLHRIVVTRCDVTDMKWFRQILEALRKVRLPKLVVMGSSSTGRGRCTRCGKPVRFLQPEKGGVAFRCEACGESGTWQ